MRTIGTFLILGILAGCSGFSDSRMNPLNWFGNAESEAVSEGESERVDPALLDERPLVSGVQNLILEPVPGGVILRVDGVVPTQGYFGGELVALADEQPIDGAIVYLLRVSAPEVAQPIGSEANRTIRVGRFIPDRSLILVRSIVVRSASNQLRTSR